MFDWPIELVGGPLCGGKFSLQGPVQDLYMDVSPILGRRAAFLYRRTKRKTQEERQIYLAVESVWLPKDWDFMPIAPS